MRARNIKPGFFKNDLLVELPFVTRLLFIGLWCMADREGRIECRYKKIKMEIFPADNIEIEEMLTELHREGFIKMYEVNKKVYLQVANFKEHQSPHHTEARSKLPAITQENLITVNSPLGLREYPPDSLIPDSLIQVKSESKEKEKTTTQKEPAEVSQAQDPELISAEAVSSSKISINEFRFLFQQATGGLMPGGLNNEASQLCKRHPRDQLEDAFRITAEQGGKTLKYLKAVLRGEPKRAPPALKTFEQQKMENTHQAVREFAGESDDGTGSENIWGHLNRGSSSLPGGAAKGDHRRLLPPSG